MTALTSLQVTSVLSYVIAVLVPALDAVLPVLPSETAVIALGVATAFEDRPWAGFAVAFGVTVVVSGLVEVARRIGRSRQRSARPGPGQADRDQRGAGAAAAYHRGTLPAQLVPEDGRGPGGSFGDHRPDRARCVTWP